MDGNGRWAKQRYLPRVAGHIRGVKRVKEIVEHCSEIGVTHLTLFAFGRENWRRPQEEVSFLMKLLSEQLNKEFYKLHEKNVKIRFIGDKTRLDSKIIQQIEQLEQLTEKNTRIQLSVALDYSGTYDIIQAVNKILAEKKHAEINEQILEQYLLTYPNPHPDLLIRTSGESRLSNFMLWQLAYAECYFTDILWPDFDKESLDLAIAWFNTRERRFGMTSEQLQRLVNA
jgi:undecaprenyl diphosphate synthase